MQTLHWPASLTVHLQIKVFCILINSVYINEGLSIVVVSMKFVLIVQPKSKNNSMKNMQATTPGFVLTSMSFKQADSKKNQAVNQQQFEPVHKSSIAKFDYCLPPEENNGPNDFIWNYHSL